MTWSIIIGDVSATMKKINTIGLWHMCLGHMSKRDLQVLYNRHALSSIKYCKLDLCKFCIMGRQHRVAFSISQHETKGLLDLIHTKVWGPSPVVSIEGAKYYVTFINNFFRRVWAYLLKQKSEVFQKFNEWITLVEIKSGKSWKSWGPTM